MCQSMRFIGTAEAKIDDKGRVFFPASFRKELQCGGEDGLVARKDIFQPCIVLYPTGVWNKLSDTLRLRLNRWNGTHQAVFRQFVAEAEAVALDANGRILLNKRLLKAAGIGRSVRFVGMDDTIEIWGSDDAGKPFMEQEEFAKSLESIMKSGAGDAGSGADCMYNEITDKQ